MTEPASQTINIREKHPLWLRCLHWIQFPVLLLMLWSGLLIYWANDVYWPPIPPTLYETFGIEQRLAEGMAYHFAFAWLFTIVGLTFIGLLIATGRWRDLAVNRSSLRDAVRIMIRKGKPTIAGYNAVQKIAYIGVHVLTVLAIATGLAIYKPVQLSLLKLSFGGYEAARWIHYLVAIGFLLFLIVHVIQVMRAGWNTFRSMIAGFEVVDEKPSPNE